MGTRLTIVLVVEDNDVNRRILTTMLKRMVRVVSMAAFILPSQSPSYHPPCLMLPMMLTSPSSGADLRRANTQKPSMGSMP